MHSTPQRNKTLLSVDILVGVENLAFYSPLEVILLRWMHDSLCSVPSDLNKASGDLDVFCFTTSNQP